jgi:hypothetical protein
VEENPASFSGQAAAAVYNRSGYFSQEKIMAKKKKPANAKYPWDHWFRARRKFLLIRGQDYDCQPHSMGVMIRAAAYARKVRTSVSIYDEKITVRVLGRRR